MKQAKKLASLLLALLVLLGLAVPALAAQHTYELYQIFTGDYADGILSNVKWGKNGTSTPGQTVEADVLRALEAVTAATSDTEKLTVIRRYADLSTEPYLTGSAGQSQFTDLPNGYYLVRDVPGTQEGENDFNTLYVVQVVDSTLTVHPKGDVPTVEKKIVEGEERVDANEASIGDTVSYEITGTLPENIADYQTYYYVFTDTLSHGLTYREDARVTLDDVDVTAWFYCGAQAAADGATALTFGIQDLLALTKLQGISVSASSRIVVRYSATLNENAVVAGAGNPNEVRLAYSNDPNNSGSGTLEPPPENPEKPSPVHPGGETPKDEVVTYTTELTVLKNDEEGNILPGAEFTLTGDGVNIVLVTVTTFTEDAEGAYWKLKNGTYTTTPPIVTGGEDDNSADYESTEIRYAKETRLTAKGRGQTQTAVSGTVDPETGRVTFTGLGAGTYTLTETVTPAGYNTIAPVTFTLTFDVKTTAFLSDNEAIRVGQDNRLAATVVNEKGSSLPGTGGMGTTLFHAAGGVLAAAALVVLLARRRLDAER